MAEIFTLTILAIKWLIAIILGIFTLFIAYCMLYQLLIFITADKKNIWNNKE